MEPKQRLKRSITNRRAQPINVWFWSTGREPELRYHCERLKSIEWLHPHTLESYLLVWLTRDQCNSAFPIESGCEASCSLQSYLRAHKTQGPCGAKGLQCMRYTASEYGRFYSSYLFVAENISAQKAVREWSMEEPYTLEAEDNSP